MELAQYTIRSKQDYIFKTNRVLEMIGASANITEAWDVLFREAGNNGIQVVRADERPFSLKDIEDGSVIAPFVVELFQGGGNLTVLYDSESTYLRLNQLFSCAVIKETPGMIPMAARTKVTGDYKTDYSCLMDAVEKEKNRMHPGRNNFVLPFSMMDRDTMQPYTDIDKAEPGKQKEVTAERKSKREKGRKIRDAYDLEEMVKLLDNMITKSGQESLLAVVHADGNNMGSKIMQMLGNDTDYNSCVNKMREFTKDTSSAFGEQALKAIEDRRQALINERRSRDLPVKESAFAFRRIIEDGDDVTFVCNARYALEYTKAYIEAVAGYKERNRSKWDYSSCAGICIFHSHYPFARAYEMAEQACDDGAKKKVHIIDENGRALNPEEGWVDFHYIHSGIGGDLSEIRDSQGTSDAMARPWMIAGKGDEVWSVDNLDRLNVILKEHGVTRSAIKEMGNEWEASHAQGKLTLDRVCGHHKGLKDKLMTVFPKSEDDLMKAIYDLSEIYDIWFEEV